MTDTIRTPNDTLLSDSPKDTFASTSQANDSGRLLASNTAARLGESARELRDSAAAFARTRAASMGDAADAAQRRMGTFAQATRQRVEQAPLKSVLVAAAAGVAVAAVLGLFRSKPDAN